MSVSVPLHAPLDPAVQASAAVPAASEPRGATSPSAAGPAPLPSPLAFARALAGLGLLGLVAVVGGDGGLARTPVGLVSAGGALLLTVPALLVAHPFLELRAAPQALLAAIARPFQRVGDVALGLVPALLLFRATSGVAPALLCLALLGLAALGFSLAVRHLVDAERVASPERWAVGKMAMLAWAWSGLALLVGARLGVGLLLGA